MSNARLLLQELGAYLEVADLGDGRPCTLAFDGTLFVDLEPDEERQLIVLTAGLGSVPAEAAPVVYRQLLQANQLWRETGGITMALDAETLEVEQILRVPLAGLDLAGFQEAIENFVNCADAWQATLAELETATPAEEPAADDGEPRAGELFIRA